MSKKDYKKGMADAISAYEAFGEKQEAAIRHVGAEIEKTAGKVDKLGGKIGKIADYITDKEKAELYKLNTPVDIADLEHAEKRILLAVLYQLSTDADEVTEEQQNYVRAVQQYLKIYNPQTEIDLEAVENIEDISAQKAVLQAALEFFRLGSHPEELTEEQEDFLDCFQVNRKTRREINSCVDAIVDAVGLQGLSEKYGFVANQPRSEFARYTDNGPIPEKVADLCIKQLKKCSLLAFYSEVYFLEAQNYLLYYLLQKEAEGFYRVDKQTGTIERIPVEVQDEFFILNVMSYSFYIWKNTIYYIKNFDAVCGDDKRSIFVLDLDAKSLREMTFRIPYKIGTCYHLSGNDNYLMIHASDISDKRIKANRTYVIDLTQSERCFVLEPPMEVIIDAFIWNGKFVFSGAKIDNHDFSALLQRCEFGQEPNVSEKITLYQYDVERNTLEEMLTPEGDFSKFYLVLGKILGGNVCEYHEIQEIQYVNGNYYFLIGDDFHWQYSLYRLPEHCSDTTYNPIVINGIEHAQSKIYLRGDSAIGWLWHKTVSLQRYDFLTRETTYPDGAEQKIQYVDDIQYHLLGDYLYKYRKEANQWFRTNVSKGWDNLQWEIMNFPD